MTEEIKQLDLTKAEDCRWYIDNFEGPYGHKITHVVMSGGRRIEFSSMNDNDAILVANQLYEMELQAAQNLKNHVVQSGGMVQ